MPPQQQLTRCYRQRQRSGFRISIGMILLFGTVYMDQKLQLQLHQLLILSSSSSSSSQQDATVAVVVSPLPIPPLPSTPPPPPQQQHRDVSLTMNETTTTGMVVGHTNHNSTTTHSHTNYDNDDRSKNSTNSTIRMSENDLPTNSNVSSLSSSSSSPLVQSFTSHKRRDDENDRLPLWFHEYAQWHTETIQHLSIHGNYQDYQYVLLRCVRKDTRCYGTSDRLKMIPVILKLAYMSQRLFFIYWSRPFPIEEFLVPNTNVMNWTVPYDLYETLDVEAVQPIWSLGRHQEYGMLDEVSQSQRVIRIMAMVYANQYYDTHPIIRNSTETTTTGRRENNDTREELPMWDVYSDFWSALFRPSPGVLDAIVTTLRDLDLLASNDDDTPHRMVLKDDDVAQQLPQQQRPLIPQIQIKPYVSVHVRANYTHDDTEFRPEEKAMRCATLLQQQYLEYMNYSNNNNTHETTNRRSRSMIDPIPIYFASDTSIVTQRALQYGLDHNVSVVSRGESRPVQSHSTNPTNTNNPYHIDQPPPVTDDFVLYPSDFYDTFVDLYLLAMGRCHTWGVGGYGSWAAVIAPKSSLDPCPSIVHYKQQC